MFIRQCATMQLILEVTDNINYVNAFCLDYWYSPNELNETCWHIILHILYLLKTKYTCNVKSYLFIYYTSWPTLLFNSKRQFIVDMIANN